VCLLVDAFLDALQDDVGSGFHADVDAVQAAVFQARQILVADSGYGLRACIRCDPLDLGEIFPD